MTARVANRWPTKKRRAVVRLAIGLSLTAMSAAAVYLLLRPNAQPRIETRAVFGSDCSHPVSLDMEVWPESGSSDARVNIHFRPWSADSSACKMLFVFFPGRTEQHLYARSGTGDDEFDAELADRGVAMTKATEFPEGTLTHTNSLLGGDFLWIRPKAIPNFFGGFEFIWRDAQVREDFGRYSLIIPMSDPDEPGAQSRDILAKLEMQPVSDLSIRLFSQPNHRLVQAAPPYDSYRWAGDRPVYGFSVNASSSDFVVVGEDEGTARMRDILLVFIAAVLGIGLTLVLEGLSGILPTDEESRARFEVFEDNEGWGFTFSVFEDAILASQRYSRIGSAFNGVASVKANSTTAERFCIEEADEAWEFSMFAANNEEIARSFPFATEEACRKALSQVRATAGTAPIEQLLTPRTTKNA